MKILFITENYFPSISGVPVVVKYLAEQLSEWGHSVSVLTRKIENTKEQEQLNGVFIYRKNLYYDFFKRYKGEKEDFVSFIKKFDADICIFECSQCITTDIFLPHLKDLRAVKILHSHGFSGLTLKIFERKSTLRNTVGNTFNWFRWKYYYKYTFKKYLNDFDRVICLSEKDSSLKYLNEFFKGEPEILGNAAEKMFFEDVDDNRILKYVPNLKGNYFLSVANFNADKNQKGILKEFYLSKQKSYAMIFVGSEKNSYYNTLIDYNKTLKDLYGERDVYFLVGVKRKDIPSIIKGASIYLVGSKVECFSISLIEAMSQGTPFISTDVGNASLLSGGITCTKTSDMHKMIDYLVNNEMECTKLSEAGRKQAFSELQIEQVTKKLEFLIKK